MSDTTLCDCNQGRQPCTCKPAQPSAPAERGVVLPERIDSWMEHGNDYHHAEGWNACLDEVARLNPAPATADSDVREVKE